MIGCYCRVSTTEQNEKGYSIDEQQERLRLYAEAHGRKDFKMYVDGGYSGASTDRPALRELLRDIKARKIDKVLVYKLDRLSRSQKDTLYLIEDEFLQNGVDFESMQERFDTSTSFGRAMVGILAVFAQLEREQIKERMSMGKAGRAKEGRWHGGGYSPIGYDYHDKELHINEYEAVHVREAFNLYASGKSIKQIEQTFLDKGYTHAHGPYNHITLKRMLENDLYVGVVKHKGEKFKGIHEPIIDKALFDRVQERRSLEKGKAAGRPTTATYLSGLMFCGKCGSRYACTSHAVGNKYRYYTCYNRRPVNKAMYSGTRCDNTNYRVDKLDELIFSELRKLSLDPSRIEESKDNLLEIKAKERTLSAQIEKLQEKKSRLIDLYGDGLFSLEMLTEKVEAIECQTKNLEAEIEALRDATGAKNRAEQLKLIESLGDILDRGIYEEIRLVIETLIDSITITGEDVIIKWRF